MVLSPPPAPLEEPQRKLQHLLPLQWPPVPSVAALFLLRASPRLTFAFAIPSPPSPHNLLKTFPPLQELDCCSLLSPPPPPRLAVQVRISLKDANHSRKQDELCFQLAGYAVSCFYLVLD